MHWLPAPPVPRRARPLVRGLYAALAALTLSVPIAPPAVAQLPPVIEDFGPADRLKSQRQREQVAALARRHLGRPLGGDGLDDLAVLQRLLDERVVAHDDELGLQSLGVVLGDVMERTLPLRWVTLEDEVGKSRALRYRDTRTLFFPVTMISKRVMADERVRVRELYDEVAAEVERLQRRERPTRRTAPRPEPPDAADDSRSGD